VNYETNLRLIRHNSQRDSKWPEYSNDLINQIWSEISNDIEFYSMPARSDCIDDRRIHKFKVNQIPVPEFLSKGNCFWYHLPPLYTDAGPRVILEAAACGLPIIADNHSGPKDRVVPEIGWLCDSVSDYIDVISDINKDLTILEKKGKAARKYAKENFIGEKWCDYIVGDIKEK
jgi:glycosyltransferase involved in cell wall biosynthesis